MIMELGIKAKLGAAFTTIPTTFRLKSVNAPPVQDCIQEYGLNCTKQAYLLQQSRINYILIKDLSLLKKYL